MINKSANVETLAKDLGFSSYKETPVFVRAILIALYIQGWRKQNA